MPYVCFASYYGRDATNSRKKHLHLFFHFCKFIAMKLGQMTDRDLLQVMVRLSLLV